MTARQRVMQWMYPVLMKVTGKKATTLYNTNRVQPNASFYNLAIELITGGMLGFETLKGKKVLLVNTASDCGYTAQYKELQQLQAAHDNLVIIGFPANDFKEQEKSDDAAIAAFCQKNFGVSFPLAKKSSVVKGPGQHKVFQWLSDARLNGWSTQAPVWNFSKYLVDEHGVLTHYFAPSISPLSKVVKQAIQF